MKFPGRGRRTPTTDEFIETYHEMYTQLQRPAGGIPPFAVTVSRASFDWAQDTRIAARLPAPGYVWGAALKLQGFHLFAKEFGWEPFLVAPNDTAPAGERYGERHNLPPLPDWRPTDDARISFEPTHRQYNIAMRYFGLEDPLQSRESFMQHGVHILGALAAMPEGSGIAVKDGRGETFGVTPGFSMGGVDPFPAGFSFK